jgi:hypothetical protein
VAPAIPRGWDSAERAKPRVAQAPYQRQILDLNLSSAYHIRGDLAAQQSVAADGTAWGTGLGRPPPRHELHRALRTGRALRRSKRSIRNGMGMIPNMVLISQRPAEVEDRAVPGHWEGDLIYGSGKTCIGTLVERSTRCLMLLKLRKNTAEEVRLAMSARIVALPAELRRSVTWDQGKEMSQHLRFGVRAPAPEP